jgi:hypothetical protein
MPRGDGTGPMGKGPRIGGQRGKRVGMRLRRRVAGGKGKGLGRGCGRKIN